MIVLLNLISVDLSFSDVGDNKTLHLSTARVHGRLSTPTTPAIIIYSPVTSIYAHADIVELAQQFPPEFKNSGLCRVCIDMVCMHG